MKLEIRYAEHPGDTKHYDTKTMRGIEVGKSCD
jgi:hypothetical protein